MTEKPDQGESADQGFEIACYAFVAHSHPKTLLLSHRLLRWRLAKAFQFKGEIMQKLWIFSATLSLAVLGSGYAMAQANLKEVCKADYSRFCSDVMPGGGRIIACLKSHEKDLQPSCAAGLKERDANKAGAQGR
ncbi:cysteine rich repeat-containing protein [Rhodomicrobium vannielii]|nr:cysteine rich repeat-containing protein [Rhodomicrobium vannielii]